MFYRWAQGIWKLSMEGIWLWRKEQLNYSWISRSVHIIPVPHIPLYSASQAPSVFRVALFNGCYLASKPGSNRFSGSNHRGNLIFCWQPLNNVTQMTEAFLITNLTIFHQAWLLASVSAVIAWAYHLLGTSFHVFQESCPYHCSFWAIMYENYVPYIYDSSNNNSIAKNMMNCPDDFFLNKSVFALIRWDFILTTSRCCAKGTELRLDTQDVHQFSQENVHHSMTQSFSLL